MSKRSFVQKMATLDVSVCFHPLSFNEWAKQGPRKKLVASWPTKAGGKSAHGFQLARAYSALQSLRRRYSIADGDSDVLIVKELLAAVTGAAAVAVAGAPPPGAAQPAAQAAAGPNRPPAPAPAVQGSRPGGDNSVLGPWKHDIGYLAQNLRDGIPGLEREVHDTIWNVEHMQKPGVASGLLRGITMLVAIYLVGGGLYKYQTMGARGMDMIPHIGFWMEFPALVLDGVRYSIFLVSEAFGSSGSRPGTFAATSTDRDTFAHFEPSK